MKVVIFTLAVFLTAQSALACNDIMYNSTVEQGAMSGPSA